MDIIKSLWGNTYLLPKKKKYGYNAHMSGMNIVPLEGYKQNWIFFHNKKILQIINFIDFNG